MFFIKLDENRHPNLHQLCGAKKLIMSALYDTAVIPQNLALVQQRVAHACAVSGRETGSVQLLLATKTVPGHLVRAAIDAGATLTGENKVQELRDKAAALEGTSAARHFIGHLQSNKVKEVLKYVSCIQSLDRLTIAEELEKRLQALGQGLEVYVQVNTSAEASKFGLEPEALLPFLNALKAYPALQLKGLMTIGLLDTDPALMRPSLQLLRRLRDEAEQHTGQALGLSMGMSGDLEMAIAEGATMVRVGTAVFGNRIPGQLVWNEQQSPS
jgi:pyridoxal phosphate enzyme (YggS family)